MRTPWGETQTIDQAGNGILFLSTAGHGGYKVPANLNKIIPSAFRDPGGFYEEDCAWAVVHYFLTSYLDKPQLALAVETLKNYYWAQYERHTGTIVDPAESSCKREHLFKIAHAKNWVVISASGDWKEGVPKGYVECIATLGESREPGTEQRTYWVRAERYDTRGNDGYVITEYDAQVILGRDASK